jgi:hypothetical protein
MKPAFLFAASLFGNAIAFVPQVFIKQSTSIRKSSVPGDFLSKTGQRVIPKKYTRKGPTGIKPGNWLERTAMVDVFIDPDFWLTWSFGLVGAFVAFSHPRKSRIAGKITNHLIQWFLTGAHGSKKPFAKRMIFTNDFSTNAKLFSFCGTLLSSDDADGSLSLLGVAGGTFHMLIAALLWVQTRRVRLVFEKDSFEFYNIKGPSLDFDQGAWLERKPDNYVSGTINRWKYDNITNWSFFPSLDYPLIVYFKETETPMEQWDKWFAVFDTYGKGQPHFFPGIVNARQFKEQMEMRGVQRKQVPAFKSMRQNLKNDDDYD